MREKDREAEVRQALLAAGYRLVQLESNLPDTVVDVVAWAADASGELVPWVAVEIKEWSKGPTRPELGLGSLSRARSSLGTREHYVLANGEWYKADSGLRKVAPVAGPSSPPYGVAGELHDVELAKSLLRDNLWKQVPSSWAKQSARVDYFFPTGRDGHSISVGDSSVPASRQVLWQAHRAALVEFARDRKSPQFVSEAAIARAVAYLAGAKLDHDVLDPFCGSGSFLWEAVERARELEFSLDSILGIEVEAEMFEMARSIAEVAPVPTEIVLGDAFEASRRTQLDAPLDVSGLAAPPFVLPLSTVVLSAPPLGGRLQEPQQLLDGSHSNDKELVALDLALRVLAHQGRAVLHLSNSFTFNARAERYRRYLSENFRIAAVIGLPGGAVVGAQVRSVLLVVDNADPGPTFVAQLGEDWRSQLAPEGAAMNAALRHLDGPVGSAR